MVTPISWFLKIICPIVPQGEISATIHNSTASVEAEVWNQLARMSDNKNANPFLSHAFFLALEQSGSAIAQTGWYPQHILLTKENKPVALMPLFLKPHSQGEYVFDHAWADAFERAGGNYYPKLQASIPFTPVTSHKLLVPSNDIELKIALLDTARQLADQLNISSIHATFVTKEEEKLAHQCGWLTRIDTQFHWQNKDYTCFDDFLKTLPSRRRKTILRERKNVLDDNISIRWLQGNSITEKHWDRFFEFYQDTGDKKWGTPYLTRTFFKQIAQSMPRNLVLILAEKNGNPVAGALNFLSGDTLFGRYWGCSEDVAFLHFEICYYQAIDYAIQHKLKTVEAGAQGGHKLSRGYEPVFTRSIHWIQNPGLRQAVENVLSHEREAVQEDHVILQKAAPFKVTSNNP